VSTGSHATVTAFNLVNGRWVAVISTKDARIGANGTVDGTKRVQGSMTTPRGTFGMTEAFGVARNPGSRMPYFRATGCDWWVEDNASKYYNNHLNACTTKTDRPLSTRSSEHLIDYRAQYKYAVVIDFNRPRPVHHRGAGIFLHINGRGATAGCVSVPESVMLYIAMWLDPALKPIITIS
jgi:L,D-peptidoglycan transpeptidase YkuD (ErfK/YbiS/YcfS/YnhG family)